jgi:hypothetical protein
VQRASVELKQIRETAAAVFSWQWCKSGEELCYMKKIYKIKIVLLFLPILLLVCIIMPGTGQAAEAEQVSLGPINSTVLFMRNGQSRTFTVESDFFPDIMTIFLFVRGSGTASISVTKTDTTGELIGVMQVGGFKSVPNSESQKFDRTVGITPCNLSISGRFYTYGLGVIMSGIIASVEPGPHKYTLTISYRGVGAL